MQRLIAASLLLIAWCVLLRAQTPAAAPKKADERVTGVIQGKAVNESGQPLAGASIFVRAVNSSGGGRTTISDADGNFRVNGLDPALYIVGGNAPAYTTPPSDPASPNYYRIGDTVRVEMIRGGVITGTVVNALGEPVIGVRVRATILRDAKGEIPRVTIAGLLDQPTDDRGIYRIYGIPPGTYIVSAGGAGFSPSFNPFDMDAPTFAPSSTRDNAVEVIVRSGEESNIDIRYRGEPGHTISGTVKVAGTSASISLSQAGRSGPVATTYLLSGARGFAFNGLSDGDYDVVAQESITNPAATSIPVLAVSEPKRVSVRGTDVTGIELTPRPLGLISGKVLLESSKVSECEGKRPPLLAETLVRIQRPEKEPDKEDPLGMRTFSSSTSPDATGTFTLRNVFPGKYQVDPRFFARYWYLQSITMTTGAAKPQKIDAAANWTMMKFGEQVTNLTITIAQGAASIRGRVPVAEGSAIPAGTTVYLVPNEADKADDVLRYFVSDVGADGTFTFNSLPPGKYLAFIDTQSTALTKLRQPEAVQARTKLRRTAETKKNEIELKPCQNLVDYQLKQ